METRIYPMNFEVTAIALSLQQAIVGYGFRPTEEELIGYLKSEVPGWRESFCVIPTLNDIYKINPWDLPAKFKEESIIPSNDREWWFICAQTQNQRISRKTPCGFSWKITGPHKDVKAGNDEQKIGSKIPLVFQDGVQTNWVIHEYHLLNNDLNRNNVLCHVKRRRDEKADNSTIESEHGAINLADFESYLHQPDHEDSFSENLIQATMDSLMENFDSPSVMDFTLENGLADEYIQLVSETSGEDEDIGYMLNGDLIDDEFFQVDQMQTLYGQTSNSHNECPVLMENRRTRTIDSLHGVVPLEEKKGMVENKFNGSLVAPKKPMAPLVCSASVKYYGIDEVPRFEKVKQETAARRIKPEYIFLDETAARSKNGQLSIMANRQTRTIGSLHGVVPLEQKKAVIQSEFNSSHVSSAKPMELPKKPKTPKMPEPPRVYINEEPWLEKVKKREIALRNVKTECVSWDEAAATAKVLKYREHCSASNSPRKKTSREIEHAREKANSVTALTRPTAKSTKSSTNPPLSNLWNVLVGIFLLFAITCQVLNL
ncbi:uncharacterized protein LOC115667788 isoform X1 [Syzygium oleosum]|uniref:uncharacterized protein LOC115667788 isoform X1 n=1 Tax=Syzygium oleosum TaxID=219896 RepID=UPI0011D18BB4|nr:uncharacterized protein LOC115667788 isoform X1 [Syzygium oleosum]